MTLRCSFCGRTKEDNIKIIEGLEANICVDCVSTCNEEVSEYEEKETIKSQKFLKPHEIKAELDKYVIGQEEAKKILSVAVYNHYKRINIKSKIDIQKTNILLLGPTGCGKTLVMNTLAKILDVPLVIADANSLTGAGYVGEDVESILEKLIIKTNGDIEKAEKGIVYIDEIDKIASKGKDISGKDPSGEDVQQGLLKMIEDSEISVSVGNGPVKNKVTINTKNILFVCGGAFVGLNDIVKKRCSSKSKQIGFGNNDSITDEDFEVTQQDLVEFGLIPEFIGRLPVIATLNALTKEDLMNILLKPQNAILKQYQALLKADGVKLDFNQSAIEFIVEEATKKNTGARGLRGVIEKKMYELMFEIPKQENIKAYTITKEMLQVKK